ARELLGGDDQHVLRLLRGDDPSGRAEGEGEAGARGSAVVRGRVLGAENGLQVARLGRQQPVRRRGRIDDGVDVERREARFLEHLQRGRLAHARVGLVLARDAPFLDARALLDPLVRGVEELREFLVLHDARGHVAAVAPEPGDRALHAGTFPSASSAAMSSERWLRTACTATRIAFLIALAGDAPWQMMTTP